jgi:hypothetical protein
MHAQRIVSVHQPLGTVQVMLCVLSTNAIHIPIGIVPPAMQPIAKCGMDRAVCRPYRLDTAMD